MARVSTRGWRLLATMMVLMGGLAALARAGESEIAELLKDAGVAYQKGYLSLATTRLYQAINVLKELEKQRAQAVFPEAPKGWTLDPANDALKDFQSLGIGALMAVGQSYRHDDTRVQLVLLQKPSAPHPLFQMLVTGLTAHLAAGLPFTASGHDGRVFCPGNGAAPAPAASPAMPAGAQDRCDAMVNIGSDYVVIANGHQATQADLLALVKAMKLDAVNGFR